MAAVPDARVPEVVDLWQTPLGILDPMLDEEIRVWRERLEWDFRGSADLVRRFVEIHALSGFALLDGGRAVGYVYYICEEHKGLIGDLFVASDYRSDETEGQLLAAVVEELAHVRGVRRIESQLMLARAGQRFQLPDAAHCRWFERNFMRHLPEPGRLAPRASGHVVFDLWSERRQDEAASLIAASYRGHVDSEINDQYRSAEGARRFLYNIVQYPGCGTFFQPASWLALDRESGRVCGLSLTSMVAGHVGHVTQICVAPSVRDQGVGYELLRRSLESLAAAGAHSVSLTVTARNENAVRLYQNMGFEIVKQFPAFVWDWR
jgi:ribosomal protein S18 acetylase RimI-like enzyme